MDTKRLQIDLKALGYYEGLIDGQHGKQTEAAYLKLLAAAQVLVDTAKVPPILPQVGDKIAWGAKLSPVFKARLKWIVAALDMPPVSGASWLASCMAWESGETFSASVLNRAGSGAVGLIQFMPSTALGLGTTVGRLALMTPEDQLNYVYKYFLPFKGRLNNLGDVYMAILWPAAVGKPDSYVLWNKATKPTTYRQNSGLDINKDAIITRAECLVKINEKLTRGLSLAYYG